MLKYQTMKIAIACDHAGYEYKEKLVEYLRTQGYEVKDFGTHSAESMDYPDTVHPMAAAVEAGEKLGFLPGDMKDKIDPYLQPLYDALEDMLPAVKLQDMIEKRVIQIAPLAFMRGRTLSDAVVILDEAQNTTTAQIRMFLTRMGWNTKMIITGDLTQVDLPHGVTSGLREAVDILKDVEGISIIRMEEKDIVRHKLVTRIVKAYKEADKTKQTTIQ